MKKNVLLFPTFLFLCLTTFFFVGNVMLPTPVFAQDSAEDMDDEEEDEDEEAFRKLPIPKPVELTGETALKTSDGVLLSATYYPGNRGKKTVPLILIHGWGGNRKDFAALALYLQKEGHAVLVADLRGHGKSTQQELGPEVRKKIDTKNKKLLFSEMLQYDLPKLKAFLRSENNQGKLNIDKLGLVGVESGAILAAAFAGKDWDPGTKRKGKANPQMGDVKAVVMISPIKTFEGVKLQDQLTATPKNSLWIRNFSGLILSGASPGSTYDSPERLEKIILAAIKQAGGTEKTVQLNSENLPVKNSGSKKVYAVTTKSKLQGAKLIAVEKDSTEFPTIAEFLSLRLKKLQYVPWVADR